MEEHLPASTRPEANTSQNQTRLVRVAENVTLQHTCRQIIIGRIDTDGKESTPVNFHRTGPNSH